MKSLKYFVNPKTLDLIRYLSRLPVIVKVVIFILCILGFIMIRKIERIGGITTLVYPTDITWKTWIYYLEVFIAYLLIFMCLFILGFFIFESITYVINLQILESITKY